MKSDGRFRGYLQLFFLRSFAFVVVGSFRSLGRLKVEGIFSILGLAQFLGVCLKLFLLIWSIFLAKMGQVVRVTI